MVASLGAELRRRRRAVGLTQSAVATELGVKRPTLSQWETDTHRPSPEHLHRLDELYSARGALVELVTPPESRMTLAAVYQAVGDALVSHLVVDTKRGPLGWSHHLTQRQPTPLSTAFALRTLQMLDQATRVDVYTLIRRIEDRHTKGGWSNRSVLGPRPEVTAMLLATLARFGQVAKLDDEVLELERSLDDFALSRPYIVSVVLECLLTIRPEAPITRRLTDALLDCRTPTGQGPLWTMDASVDPERIQPSLAHTARAAYILRWANQVRPEARIEEAIGSAIEWIVGLDPADDWATEILRINPADRSADVPVNHFTSAWILRALAGIEDVPPASGKLALDGVWESYAGHEGLWAWRADGSLPCWMTHDAVAALKTHALTSALTPVMTNP